MRARHPFLVGRLQNTQKVHVTFESGLRSVNEQHATAKEKDNKRTDQVYIIQDYRLQEILLFFKEQKFKFKESRPLFRKPKKVFSRQ